MGRSEPAGGGPQARQAQRALARGRHFSSKSKAIHENLVTQPQSPEAVNEYLNYLKAKRADRILANQFAKGLSLTCDEASNGSEHVEFPNDRKRREDNVSTANQSVAVTLHLNPIGASLDNLLETKKQDVDLAAKSSVSENTNAHTSETPDSAEAMDWSGVSH